MNEYTAESHLVFLVSLIVSSNMKIGPDMEHEVG